MLGKNIEYQIFSKMVSCARTYIARPLKIFNLVLPEVNQAQIATGNCEVIDVSTCTQADYSLLITNALAGQYYDLIFGIDAAKLLDSPENISDSIIQVSQNSGIAVYKFPSFDSYFANQYLKKNYRYREIIHTHSPVIYVFCSNNYWYANGNLAAFDPPPKLTREWVGTTNGVRRYYFNSEQILRYYELNGEAGDHIAREIKAEADFLLDNNSVQGFAPQLIDYHIATYDGWILRQKAPGITLSELLDECGAYDAISVFKSILQQVIFLEKKQLFHIKLRPRNIIVLEQGGALLVDYGAIAHRKKHFLPGYHGFLMLSYEIFHRQHMVAREFSPICLMEPKLNARYVRWLKLILSVPPQLWSFQLFEQLFAESEAVEIVCKIDYEHFQGWLRKIQHKIENRRLRLEKFEVLISGKLNSFFKRWSILSLLREKLVITFDSLFLSLESFCRKKVL